VFDEKDIDERKMRTPENGSSLYLIIVTSSQRENQGENLQRYSHCLYNKEQVPWMNKIDEELQRKYIQPSKKLCCSSLLFCEQMQ